MAIEILGNAIRVTKEDTSPVEAIFKDATGTAITTGDIYLVVEETSIKVKGTYASNVWTFNVPPSQLSGRYMYHFELEGELLDFPQAIYFE